MTRHAASAGFAVALFTIVTLVLVGAFTASTASHSVLLGPPSIGRVPPQVALTADYSVIGGSSSQALDLLTYVSNGATQVVPLTGVLTTYMVDSGTQWSAQTTLNGSTNSERWITGQDVSGVISAPLTIAFSYYHQYSATFKFNVTKGGSGFSNPSVSFNQMGSSVSLPASQAVWVDASSPYSYPSLLPGSSLSERWTISSVGSGTVTGPGTVLVSYNHEYLLSSSYSVVGGAGPIPQLSSAVLGASVTVPMTTSIQGVWFDAGATYTMSPVLTTLTVGERWQGTVLVNTQSGNVLSFVTNGTLNAPTSITPVYYHQYLVNVSFTFNGGVLGALPPPPFNYLSFGSKASANNNTAIWVDAGIQYTLPETICCPSSPSSERWELNNSTTGTISRATKISSTYFHQYFDLFSYSVVGQQPPSPSGQPGLTYIVAGNSQQLTLTQTPQGAWADAGSSYSVTSTLPGSTASERWFAFATGSITGPSPNTSVVITYNHQYLLTIVGGGLSTQWVNAGNSTTLSTPGVFGRSQGAGFRVVSYQIDTGSVVTISLPAVQLSIPLTLNGPHTITFKSVRQFQLSLDSGATSAISSITPPTVPGDNYWYDTDSQVQVTLSGAFARLNGVGQRISTISVTAQPVIHVSSVAAVQAFTTASIQTPISITTTSTTQYEVVLNTAATTAFLSITPSSTFPGDTFWYDSGAPPVTVMLNGVYGRSAGSGFRVSSVEIDNGPITKVASTGTVSVGTGALTAPHFVNATVVLQYQVTIDSGGTSALVSMTTPSIPQDTGWYDASSPLGVVMNGVWARASGTGHRLAGYSVNGGPQVSVASSGLVPILNVTKLASTEFITTTVVTQYQVTLDAGASVALGSITSTPLAKDNYWYDGGTPVSVSLNGVWGRTANSGNRLLSYSVNAGASTTALSSAPVQVLSLSAISGPASISTKTVLQYHLNSSPVAWASLTDPTIPNDAGWFDSGAAVKAVYNATWSGTTPGSRASVTSYSVDGGTKTNVPRSGAGTFTVAVVMNAAHGITLVSTTQYLLTVTGPAKATATPPSQTGDAYFDTGSKVTFTVPTVVNGSSKPGVRQIVTSYSLDGGNPLNFNSTVGTTSFVTPSIVFTKPHTLALNAITQYLVDFKFFDNLGSTPIVPSNVQLGIGNATLDVQGQSIWLANGTSFRVLSVIWEGAPVGPTSLPSFQVQAAPLNVTMNARVYPASLKVVDLLGLPVSGAQVTMTLANGTILTGTTKGDGTYAVGMVPLGTFTATVSNLGSTVKVVGDSASSQPVAQGKVALSLISVIAIVAIVVGVAVAAVVLLRKRKEVGEGITV